METYLPYTKALKDFMAKYNEDIQKDQMKFEDCTGKFIPNSRQLICEAQLL